MKFCSSFLHFLLVVTFAESHHNCTSFNDKSYGFGCRMSNLNPENKSLEITLSSQDSGKTNKDVVWIQIHNSELENLPRDIFGTFENLENIIIIKSNGLKNLTVPLFDEKLKLIFMKNTDLELIGENAFEDLKDLETLSLNYNKIKEIHKRAFHDLVNIQRIELINNHIESLDDKVFSQTQHIKYISLRNNKIKSISSKLFENNIHIKTLQLQNNVISQIEREFYLPLKSLTRLVLTNNICTDENFSLSPGVPWTKHQNVQLRDCYKNFDQFKSENEKFKASETEKQKLVSTTTLVSNTTPNSDENNENLDKIKNDLLASMEEVRENLTEYFFSDLKLLETNMMKSSDARKIKSDLLVDMKADFDKLTNNVNKELDSLRDKIENSPDLEAIQKDVKDSLEKNSEKMANNLENNLKKTISRLETDMAQKIEEKLERADDANREKLVSETSGDPIDDFQEKLLKIYFLLFGLACFNVFILVTTLLVLCKTKKKRSFRPKIIPNVNVQYESQNQDHLRF